MSRLRSSISAFVIVGAAVACGGDSTGPTSNAPATLDQALAEMSLPALAAGGPTFVDIGAATPSFDPTTCSYSATTQNFVCTPISKSGITLLQSITLLSGAGVKQSAFDPTGTAAVRANTNVDGTLVEQATSVRVYGQQELTLSGLVSGPHVLNGWSSLTVAGTVADGTSTYPVNVRVNTAIAKLVLPANGASGARAWPSSGTLIVDVVGAVGLVVVSQTRTEIEFSGTSTVDITVSGGGNLAVGCRVNLAVAKPACA